MTIADMDNTVGEPQRLAWKPDCQDDGGNEE